jgi:hypothetical protein
MTNVSEKYSCASRIERYYAIQKQCSPKSQVPTGGSTLYIFARHSSHKAGTNLLPKGKAFRFEQNVLVYVNSRKILSVLLNQRHFVLLSDEALSVSGVIATVQLYFTAEKLVEILVGRPSTLPTKAV